MFEEGEILRFYFLNDIIFPHQSIELAFMRTFLTHIFLTIQIFILKFNFCLSKYLIKFIRRKSNIFNLLLSIVLVLSRISLQLAPHFLHLFILSIYHLSVTLYICWFCVYVFFHISFPIVWLVICEINLWPPIIFSRKAHCFLHHLPFSKLRIDVWIIVWRSTGGILRIFFNLSFVISFTNDSAIQHTVRLGFWLRNENIFFCEIFAEVNSKDIWLKRILLCSNWWARARIYRCFLFVFLLKFIAMFAMIHWKNIWLVIVLVTD